MEEMTTPKYNLRELQSKDLFPMFALVNKIGFSEVKTIFETENMRKLVTSKGDGMDVNAVGMTVVMEIVGVIMANITKCESDIFNFISSISGMKPEEIEKMAIDEFAEIIIEIVRKKEFKDFFKVVSKLFK